MWERNIYQLPSIYTPTRESNLQPRYMLWPGIRPTTFWCMGWCSNQQSHLARAKISLLFMAKYYSITYTTSFICSSIDGHLGYIRILAVVNNAAMNIMVHISFQIRFLDVCGYPEVESLGHKAVPFLIIWGNSILFSIGAAPISIPSSSSWGFPFLHIPTNTCWFIDDIHSDTWEVTSHCGFD